MFIVCIVCIVVYCCLLLVESSQLVEVYQYFWGMIVPEK
jgi:hypothetical protein